MTVSTALRDATAGRGADGRCVPGRPAHARTCRGRSRVLRGHGPLGALAARSARITPDVVLADKAYSSRAIRTYLRRRGIRAVIPQPADQAANRKRLGSRGGIPPAFDRDAYEQRNTVERCINKLKQRRGLATRYDKTAIICLAVIFIWSVR